MNPDPPFPRSPEDPENLDRLRRQALRRLQGEDSGQDRGQDQSIDEPLERLDSSPQRRGPDLDMVVVYGGPPAGRFPSPSPSEEITQLPEQLPSPPTRSRISAVTVYGAPPIAYRPPPTEPLPPPEPRPPAPVYGGPPASFGGGTRPALRLPLILGILGALLILFAVIAAFFLSRN